MKADAINLHRNEDFAFRAPLVRPGREGRQHRLKTGVEHGGMQSIVGQVLVQATRDVHLGQHFPLAPPQSLHSLEGRAVMIPGGRKPAVALVSVEGIGTAPANLREIDLDRCRLGGSHAPLCVHVPGIVGTVGANADGELARGRVQLNLHRECDVLIENEEFLKLEILQIAGDRPENLSRRRERHFDVSRTGKNDRATDPMVHQIAQVGRNEIAAPGWLRHVEPDSQQRMNRPANADAVVLLGFAPIALRLKRIGGQLDRRRFGRVELAPIDLGTKRIQSAERAQQRRSLAILPAQRAQRRPLRIPFV